MRLMAWLMRCLLPYVTLLLLPAISHAQEVTVDPTQGPPGTNVTVRGTGLEPDILIHIVLYEEDPVATTQTDGNGAFTTTFTVPQDAPVGDMLVNVANESYSRLGKAVFTVVMEPGGQLPPEITRVETFREGDLVFFRLFYTDPNNDAEGFGFVGVNGSGWAEQTLPFSSPAHGRVYPGIIEYPFNHLCDTGPAYESDVEAWIYDSAGLISLPVTIHLACDEAGQPPVGACEGAAGFRHPLDEQWVMTQSFANYLTTYGGQTYNGYHSAEDLAFSDTTARRPVYAIGAGKIAKISNLTGSGLGYLVAIEHNGSFTIPGKNDTVNGQMYTYNTEIVETIYSIYLHVDPEIEITEGTCVKKGDQIATLASIGAPHLHFEIRHPSQRPSGDWSLVGQSSNWQTFPGTNAYNGYYINVQAVVDGGVRHPSEFLNANP